jgi:hypothetical protein
MEPGVTVAPSTVNGLGVFTTKAFAKGDIVCMYSGDCIGNVKGNLSKYLLECYDEKTGAVWYLDAISLKNYCARYINDARGTDYDWNVAFHDYMRYDAYTGRQVVCVYALHDIPAGVELFVDYGNKYWEVMERHR